MPANCLDASRLDPAAGTSSKEAEQPSRGNCVTRVGVHMPNRLLRVAQSLFSLRALPNGGTQHGMLWDGGMQCKTQHARQQQYEVTHRVTTRACVNNSTQNSGSTNRNKPLVFKSKITNAVYTHQQHPLEEAVVAWIHSDGGRILNNVDMAITHAILMPRNIADSQTFAHQKAKSQT